MSMKTLFWTLAVLIVTEGVVARDLSPNDVVTAALNKTQAAAQNANSAAQAASQELQAMVSKLIQSSEKVMQDFQGPIQNIFDKVLQEINKALGDLPSCAAGQQDAVARLVQGTEMQLLSCITDRVAEVGKVVRDVATLAGEALVLPHQASANISVCLQRPLTAVFCAAGVVCAAEQQSERIVTAIAADIQKGEQLIVSAPHDIASCGASKLDAAAEGANRIIVDIAQCVVDGSSSSTSKTSSS